MARILEEPVDPALRAVIRRYVVVEEQLAEHDPTADVRERAESQDAAGRLDEPGDVGVLVDDRLDDRADGLVDQWDPELFVHLRGLWLLRPGPPGDLPRGADHQHGEELAQHVLR